ncbi:hypothetical protein GE115_02655 [Agromyces sp. CFH 90414]|uniref:Uncharacterized protein n=1 Tax=Agromyces agglutinans TaxID=2662258 RepID=A0A6I2FCC2_9MICO|nr:hypothetical protein [Agromyces agglutinans]MRG58778.1 hypothetical protein [Agromyces agglutinans]
MIYPLVRACRDQSACQGAGRGEVPGPSYRAAAVPFYRWLKDPVSDRYWEEAQLINATVDTHAEAPAFAYRLIADELG